MSYPCLACNGTGKYYIVHNLKSFVSPSPEGAAEICRKMIEFWRQHNPDYANLDMVIDDPPLLVFAEGFYCKTCEGTGNSQDSRKKEGYFYPGDSYDEYLSDTGRNRPIDWKTFPEEIERFKRELEI